MQSKIKLRFLAGVSICLLLTGCGDKKARAPLIKQSLKDMAFVPGGSYQMGTQDERFLVDGDWLVHQVTLSPFYIDKYNTSYKKLDLYTKASGKSKIHKDDIGTFREPNYPANFLTWYQANAYCSYLAKITGLPYALPTEAQWEYVARNNGKPHWDFPTNNGRLELGKNFPNMTQLTAKVGLSHGLVGPLPVGSIPCTPQGICGLQGAVIQWVKDWYSEYYYKKSPKLDPQGPASGTFKITRGQPALSSPQQSFNYGRYNTKPTEHFGGFRCVINSAKPMSELKEIAKKHLSS